MRPSRTGDVTPSTAWAPVSSPPFIPQKDDPTTYHLSSPPSDLTSPPPSYCLRPAPQDRISSVRSLHSKERPAQLHTAHTSRPMVPARDRDRIETVRWLSPSLGVNTHLTSTHAQAQIHTVRWRHPCLRTGI